MSVTLSRTGAVGVLTLDRPPVNAFDEGQAGEFATAVAELGADTSVRAVVVRSVAKVFCARSAVCLGAHRNPSTHPHRGDRAPLGRIRFPLG
ncbi:hypothetical protein IRT45_33125 [Nocardia sp. BSTN01]|uniref:enoyl-CoA hydratase-related protein n=1 Tax=Nocardia sp. BSTN01 TaxID=2783665 RepID=UPI00188E4EEA|nr:hypothetical protein [Nocardia sp. BSTN01]